MLEIEPTANKIVVEQPGDVMDEKALFTNFWTTESVTTHKVLERIPEGSDYRPDPKSRTAQEIAWQMVCEEKMIIEALENGKAEWAPPPMPESMKEILHAYDEQSAMMAERWNALKGDQWSGDLDFFGSPRPASPMAWSFFFDIIHHRGQITTYLRPMGSTVPQVYGPSGDEP
ncbi:MAG: DinB family protein [Gemmatimonadales bacterium]